MKNAVIFFTKAPIAKFSKTRLLDFLSPAQCVRLSKFLICRIYGELKKLKDVDIFVFYTPNDADEILKNLIGEAKFYPQKSGDLNERMKDAFSRIYALGYEKIVLLGSDIVNFKASRIMQSFKALDSKDAAITPTHDGGYCVLALKRVQNLQNFQGSQNLQSVLDEIFSANLNERSGVCDALCAKFDALGLTYRKFSKFRDIDTKEDIFCHVLGVRSVKPLASGEYNINYKFKQGGQTLVFRINTKSQMGLKNQIKYEFDALKVLESSGVTPRALRYFAPSVFLPRGAIVMEFLKGRALRYESDLKIAAYLLAKIHAVKAPPAHSLVTAQKPMLAIYEECQKMAEIYLKSKVARRSTSAYLQEFLDIAAKFDLARECENPCIINTELNSRNFIIGSDEKSSFVIDWEKPIIGEKEQDLAHFLAPTTTFWKTDKILTRNQIDDFIAHYEKCSNLRVDMAKFSAYLRITCLRGVSWCAMAYVEYCGARAIKNEYTFNKIKAYLGDKFLSELSENFKEII